MIRPGTQAGSILGPTPTRFLSDRFASRLDTLDEAPEPFRRALAEHLADDSPHLLIYGPPWVSLKTRNPATVLAVTNQRWLIAFDTPGGQASVVQCDFANTLLVELTVILLYGQLRIEFVAGGPAQWAELQFNTVMEKLYDEAVQLLLAGMEKTRLSVQAVNPDAELLRRNLPFTFQNALLKFTPRGQQALDLVHWPACYGGKRRWFQHELAPEAALALTDRELLLISEEKTWSWLRIGHPNKYGNIVTHCPLSRLEGYHLSESRPLATLHLALRAGSAVGDMVQIALPFEHKAAVQEVVLRAFALKGKASVATCTESYGQSAPC